MTHIERNHDGTQEYLPAARRSVRGEHRQGATTDQRHLQAWAAHLQAVVTSQSARGVERRPARPVVVAACSSTSTAFLTASSAARRVSTNFRSAAPSVNVYGERQNFVVVAEGVPGVGPLSAARVADVPSRFAARRAATGWAEGAATGGCGRRAGAGVWRSPGDGGSGGRGQARPEACGRGSRGAGLAGPVGDGPCEGESRDRGERGGLDDVAQKTDPRGGGNRWGVEWGSKSLNHAFHVEDMKSVRVLKQTLGA